MLPNFALDYPVHAEREIESEREREREKERERELVFDWVYTKCMKYCSIIQCLG